MQNNKVKEVSLISAINQVDNSVDAEREFDVRANVTSTVEKVTSINSGEVRILGSGATLASFSLSEHGNDQINPTSGLETSVKLRVIAAIYDFVEAVKAMYADPNAIV